MPDRQPLDLNAYALMVLLAALWGFQQAAIKIVASDVSLLMQGAIRSAAATGLLLAWARLRGTALFERDGTLPAGMLAGLLFGGEFVFIYAGLGHTSASRMVVFLYLTPPLTALALHFFVRGEQLRVTQWCGVLVAFSGLVLAFADGFLSSQGTTVGDLCGIAAALCWTALTIVIRRSRLGEATATKTFFYQISVSAVMLALASMLLREPGVVVLTPLATASLAYQTMVAFAGYLAWLWLLTRYKAGPLSVMSFLTPLFGVLSGVLVLSEPLTGTFAAATLLIGGGIVLVNLPLQKLR